MEHSQISPVVAAAARTLAVDQVTAEVVTLLQARGVTPVLLKGPSFAGWLYSPDELRPYVDTDLLVAPADQDVAAEVLTELGFDDPMRSALAHERDDHSRTFYRSAGTTVQEVDLHFSLAGAAAEPLAVWAALTRRLEPVTIAGVAVAALAAPGRVLHVALHAAQDGRRTDQPIADLERALRVADRPAWVAAAALAREIGAVPAFAAGLERLPRGAELLDELGLAGESGAYERLRGGTPPPMSLGVARLLERRDARGLLGELARELVPTPSFMRVWSPLARRGRLGLAAAYVWRPWWLLWRLGPALRAYRKAARGGGRA